MKILPNCPIKELHSFHFDVKARYWAQYDDVEELKAILRDANTFGLPIMSVGGGCNLLFDGDYPGILLHSEIRSLEWKELPEGRIWVRAGAGIEWDRLVSDCVEKGWGGLENLSGIPGCVGASPVQNVGAYGVEAKDCIQNVEVLDRETLETAVIPASECRFGYRQSRFKGEWKERYVVTHVQFLLQSVPQFKLEYGALKEKVAALGGPSLKNVRQAVLEIRGSKLPDPALLGNAGSFFVNPEVNAEKAASLKRDWPDMPAWPLEDGRVKISAAWMIDRCGWKGRRTGACGVYEKQALVLVNYGEARGSDVMALYQAIAQDVERVFGVSLKAEVILVKGE